MALVNRAKREINAKIVFFGPELAGKATTLTHVFGKLKPEFRGKMKAMNVQDARMLFFDFTPPGDGNVQGFRVRIHVYTVSGHVADAATWKMVLKGVDGVVFVADAAPQRLDADRKSLQELAAYLNGFGQSLSAIPMVFQFNKSDLPDALEVGEMERMLNPAGLPSFKATSQSGDGVLQTLLCLVKTVLSELRGKGLQGIASGDGLQHIVETTAAASTPTAAGSALLSPLRVRLAAQSSQELSLEDATPQLQTPAAVSTEELSLELSGELQGAGPGLFRLPLTIRAGARTKSVVLSVSVSLEDE